MNADRLLSHFEKISDAPDAVDRLRRFILDLAVRGKLAEQDEGDPRPPESLQLTDDAGPHRTERPANHRYLTTEDERYPVPTSWLWTRLGMIGDWGSGTTPSRGKAEYFGGTISWFKSGELNDNLCLAGSEERVTQLALKQCSFRHNRPGDVLFAMYGATIGKVAILAEEAVTNQAVVACSPCAHVLNRYLFLFLLSQRQRFRMASEGGAQPNVSKAKVVRCPIPLPPLAEQHRIVAKVDELMELCDQLESSQQEQESRRDRLVVASLNRLSQPTDPDEFRKDAGFQLSNLHRLSTKPEHIKELRKAILNLAVRGELVPQDEREGTAVELLNDIRQSRATTASKGRRVTGQGAAALAAEQPYSLPSSWAWTAFGSLITHSDSGWSPKTEGFPRTGDEWGVLKVSAVSWDVFQPEENKQLLPGVVPPESAVVCKGDFLISRANTSQLIARCVIVGVAPRNLIMSDKIVRLRLVEQCDPYFLKIVNNDAAHARDFYAAKATGTSLSMKNVSRDVIYDLPIPLPPLDEQKRIVAKVDELMLICDQLEAQLEYQQKGRRKLLEALLHEALEGVG